MRRPCPEDLCPEHRRIWLTWRNLTYNPWHPQEWPGGSIIMDNRTLHETRRRDWDRKSEEQMDLTEKICRRGDSPQCGERTK